MNNQHPPIKLIKRRLLTVAGLGVLLLFLYALAGYPLVLQRYYTFGIYLYIAGALHTLFNIFPFSVGDVLYLLLIALLLYALVKILRLAFARQFRMAGYFALKIAIGVQICIAAFYLLWGLNYFRPAMADALPAGDKEYSIDDIKTVTAMLIDSTNASAAMVTPADRQQTNAGIYQQAIQAVTKLGKTNPEFSIYKPGVKPAMFTPLLNYLGTLGYYNPFTGEAQMNYQMPVVNKPVTCCHEIGHQMGYGREDEANYIGFLAGSHSQNRLLSYSAYYQATSEFLYYLRRRDSVSYRQLRQRLSGTVKADMKADSIYWTGFQTKASAISALFYDQFLKANNQPAGLHTYNAMIVLTMAYYKRRHVY